MRWLALVVAYAIWTQRTFRMFPDWLNQKQSDPQSPDYYYEVRLTTLQRDLVLEAVKRLTTASGTLKKNAVQALELARLMPGPVKPLMDFDAMDAELARRNKDAPGRWTIGDLAAEKPKEAKQ